MFHLHDNILFFNLVIYYSKYSQLRETIEGWNIVRHEKAIEEEYERFVHKKCFEEVDINV